MKHIFNSCKLAAIVALAVLPIFAGCSKEEVKEGIDTTKNASVQSAEEEVEKPTVSVGIVD